MGDECIGRVLGNVLSSTLVKAKVRKDNTEQRAGFPDRPRKGVQSTHWVL